MKYRKKEDFKVYAVTDRRWLGEDTLCHQVEQAIMGGVTFVQLREKELSEEALLKEAVEIQELCRRYHVPMVINDRVDIALQMGADGVHVGQKDMEAGEVRKRLGPDKLLGVTARSVEQALLAEKNGADYLGVGAVFPTGSKSDAQVIERETLRQICEAVSIPVVAIGGISGENVLQLQGNGIAGVAVISGIFGQLDIRKAAQKLRNTVDEMLS